MNTATMSVARGSDGVTVDKVAAWLLFAFVASLQISIAAANILLTAVLLCWVVMLVQGRTRPSAPMFFVPLAAYAAMTLVATAFSISPIESLVDSRQLLLFLIVPAVYEIARGQRASSVLSVIISVGAVSAVYGIIQFGVLHYDSLGRRPEGAMSHYMTYSGLVMLVTCAAAARIIFGSRDRIWPALIMPALVVALPLTFSRSAEVGVLLGVALLLVLKDFRLTALLPIAIALFFAFAPDSVTDRMVSMFDMKDPTVRDRVAMLNTGRAMVESDPLTGVGPNMVERLYPQYRDPNGVNATNPHLHNVPVQIAAERGLPALAIWGWLMVAIVVALAQVFQRAREHRVLAAAGLSAVVAMLGAGLFEYNFGDSEFLMLLLVLVTLPFAASRPDHAAASPRA